MVGTGVYLAPTFFLPWNIKYKVGKEIPPDTLLMDNLETSLITTVDKARGNTGRAILERLIKSRASKIFFTWYMFWMGQSNQLKFQGHMRSFSMVLSEYE